MASQDNLDVFGWFVVLMGVIAFGSIVGLGIGLTVNAFTAPDWTIVHDSPSGRCYERNMATDAMFEVDMSLCAK
jgi:hypothetical protein